MTTTNSTTNSVPQELNLDYTKWAQTVQPIEYQVVAEFSTLIILTKKDLVLYHSAVCTAQQLGIFLSGGAVAAANLCANLQKWKSEIKTYNMEVLFSDLELKILNASLSFVTLQMSVEGNRFSQLLIKIPTGAGA